MEPSSCCSPAREPATVHATQRAFESERPTEPGDHAIEQVAVPGGPFMMGDSFGDGHAADGERPVHEVDVSPFSMDATSVTNDAFARFVAAAGYITEAESFGFSAVFHTAVQADGADETGRPERAPWWVGVNGADWQHPGGRYSSLKGLGDHPVVHVSWNDAQSYCRWAGRRLPTEAEWECAARAGAPGARYPWGNELMRHGQWPCNIWQGQFPTVNTLDDGWLTTAPVRSYSPNDYGLWQMVGNVWEWCQDWFDAGYYRASQTANPTGPETGSARVLRGGSYLCHDSYCNRYRSAARSSNTADSSMGNTGFRSVA